MCFGIGQSGRQEKSFSWNMVCKQMPSRKHLSTTINNAQGLVTAGSIYSDGWISTEKNKMKDPKMCGPCLKEENGLFEMCSPFNEDSASLGDVGGIFLGRLVGIQPPCVATFFYPQDVGFMAYNVLASGMLTGKYLDAPAAPDEPNPMQSFARTASPRGRMDDISWGTSMVAMDVAGSFLYHMD